MSWNYDAQLKLNRRTRDFTSRRPPQRSVTILIVEDNDNLRNVLHRALEGNGFPVLVAADGAEALGLCQQHDGAIDLVVSDIVMPRLDGLELSERIRSARPETKFLFITGFGDQFPELGELIKYGANIWKSPSFFRNSCVKSKTRSTRKKQPRVQKDRPFYIQIRPSSSI